MFIYFDSNGVLKEIISDGAFRNGDSARDKIYIYVEGEPYINSAWIKFRLPNGNETVESCFFDRTTPIPQVAKELPLEPKRNLKYFDYNHTYVSGGVNHLGYMFYEIEVPSAVLNSSLDDDDETPTSNNMVIGRARFVYPDSSIMSLGAITFSVESNIGILTDNSINETQYNYLLSKSDLGNPIYFTPYFVGTELHFSNNGNLPNPAGVNLKGERGVSVDNFTKISTSGLTDTYRLSLDDGTYYDIPIKNGKSITKIEKLGTSDLVDTYGIFYNDGTVWDFDVTNGKDGVSIDYITKTASVDNIDTYTIYFTDGNSYDFDVVNGIDGADGDSAGFGSPSITVNMLAAGSTPTASVGASGPDTAKVFSFVLNIPKGDTGESTQWYFGNGSPANDLCNIGDIYCNQTNYDVYLKTGETTWTLKGNIKGATGRGIDHIVMTGHNFGTNTDTYTIYYTDGTTSTYGVNGGTLWFNGNGSPSSSFGNTGDYYLDNTNGDIYKKIYNSGWTLQCNLQGAKGDPGAAGQNGTNGTNGATFTPSVASNGDLSWSNNGGLSNPATVNIKGPKGDTGGSYIYHNGSLTVGTLGDSGIIPQLSMKKFINFYIIKDNIKYSVFGVPLLNYQDPQGSALYYIDDGGLEALNEDTISSQEEWLSMVIYYEYWDTI